jgi:hypothetical protein
MTLATFKGHNYQKHILYVLEFSYPNPKKIYKFKGASKKCRACGVIDTACTFENRSYLGEFEAEFKKALARESGAPGGIV